MSVIFSRAPLRISLGGGGTDLPSYYREHGGFLVVGRDRQVRLHAHPHRLPAALPHEVLRAGGGRRDRARSATRSCARRCCATGAATRWRSPRSPTCPRAPAWAPRAPTPCACSRAWRTRAAPRSRPATLAEAACEIEIDVLGEPVGKQDPYVAAHGGICAYTFHPDGSGRGRAARARPGGAAAPARPAAAVLHRRGALGLEGAGRPGRPLQGRRRADAREPAPHQGARPPAAASCSQRGDLEGYAELMHEHWEHKRRRSPGMTDEHIDRLYDARAAQRRDRRQAGRRRRRRVPARLHAPAGGHPAGDGRGRAPRAAVRLRVRRRVRERVRMSAAARRDRRLRADRRQARAALSRRRRAGRLLRHRRARGARASPTRHGARVCASSQELLALAPEVVVVATVHDQLAGSPSRRCAAGAHVLVEKPAGISHARRSSRLIECQRDSGGS